MIKPFTYDGETYHIRDNIGLVQALERCAAAYHNRCLSNLGQDYPNPMWVRLYAASERLKQAVRHNDVLKEILKIGSSLLGFDGMAVLELHGTVNLSLLAGSGMTAVRRQALVANTDAVASAIPAGQISIVNTDTPYNQLWLEIGITAFVPLWHEGNPRGAIIFYQFLAEQSDLDLADRELLRLLAMFGGPSLFNRAEALF
ncbi:MAG TPA: GAF domain-containing protein [Candidatus Angelobacter sp.]|nr:GAF domain-containing protein [Candidatus Angelobacter sp.]